MKVTFLGTGTSQGVPVIACDCRVCQSDDQRDKRLRTSVLIQVASLNIIIDAGPDFRYQVLRSGLQRLDAVLFTHQHRDHIAGLDDVRSFNFKQKMAMPIYGNAMVIEQIKREMHYVFEKSYPGVPQLDIHQIDNHPFVINEVPVLPVQVLHHKLPVFGYRIFDFAYITDANTIHREEMKKLKGTKTLVINALQQDKHLSHFTLQEALEVIEQIGPEVAYLTHVSHNMGLHAEVSKNLPTHVHFAYDGLRIAVN